MGVWGSRLCVCGRVCVCNIYVLGIYIYMFGGGVSYRVICVYGHSLIQNKPVGHIAKYTFYLFTGKEKIFYRVR